MFLKKFEISSEFNFKFGWAVPVVFLIFKQNLDKLDLTAGLAYG